jgi:predicted HTH transcriptional regulator
MAATILTQDEVEKLLKNGENEHTEFKLKNPNPLVIAKNIGAFANRDGGVIIIGAGENGEVRSADFFAVQKVVGMDCTPDSRQLVKQRYLKQTPLRTVLEIYSQEMNAASSCCTPFQ